MYVHDTSWSSSCVSPSFAHLEAYTSTIHPNYEIEIEMHGACLQNVPYFQFFHDISACIFGDVGQLYRLFSWRWVLALFVINFVQYIYAHLTSHYRTLSCTISYYCLRWRLLSLSRSLFVNKDRDLIKTMSCNLSSEFCCWATMYFDVGTCSILCK